MPIMKKNTDESWIEVETILLVEMTVLVMVWENNVFMTISPPDSSDEDEEELELEESSHESSETAEATNYDIDTI